MAKSKRVRTEDSRALFLLGGECRDLGHDPLAWRRHFLEGVARLTGAAVGNLGLWTGIEDLMDAAPSRWPLRPMAKLPELVRVAAWREDNRFEESHRARLEQMLTEFFQTGWAVHPMLGPYLSALAKDNGVCLTREVLGISSPEWRRSAYFRDYHNEVDGGGPLLYCHWRSSAVRYHELSLIRSKGVRDFSPRQQQMVRELHTAVAREVGESLADFDEPTSADLPPRCQEVLECLCTQKNSAKEIAQRLGITVYAVRPHMERICKHFGVNDKLQLLGHLARRRASDSPRRMPQ